MIYDGPRHRGACRISEGPAPRRKYFKKCLRVSNNTLYQAWKASNDRLAETEALAEAAFLLSLDTVKLRTRPTFEMIQAIYRKTHPRAIIAQP